LADDTEAVPPTPGDNEAGLVLFVTIDFVVVVERRYRVVAASLYRGVLSVMLVRDFLGC
jgi:hypothetical protein